MEKETLTLKINDIVGKKTLFSDIIAHSDDYLIAVLSNSGADILPTGQPCRFDGLIFMYCSSGEYVIKKGYAEIALRDRNFMAIYPDDIIKGVDTREAGELTGLFLSRNFIRDLNFNLSVFSSLDMLGVRTPVIKLTAQDFETLTHYFSLLKLNAQNRVNADIDVFTRNIARNVTAALFYNLMLLTRDSRRSSRQGKQTSRKTTYVLDFMALLQNEYKRERTVKYYADKLCISSKYLSILIKSATGKSAAEWIDDCVILEAKNLLRFSGMNVQQVAYELNFTNQSAFGKYFKHLTGMSPTHFQNS